MSDLEDLADRFGIEAETIDEIEEAFNQLMEDHYKIGREAAIYTLCDLLGIESDGAIDSAFHAIQDLTFTVDKISWLNALCFRLGINPPPAELKIGHWPTMKVAKWIRANLT